MNFPVPRPRLPSLELLEARIAPATLSVGIIGNTSDAEYSDAPFVNMFAGADDISNAVGHALNTYYIKLGAGEQFNAIKVGDPSSPLITVAAGTVVAFFRDLNTDGEIQADELISLSLGPKVSVTVSGDLSGDVVSNYDVAGDTINMAGIIPGQGIKNFSAGNLGAKLLTGGPIAKATFTSVVGVYTGSATDGQSFDFFPGVSSGAGTLAFAPATGKAGPSISNLTVERIDEIRAGEGGAGAAGGAVTNIRITNDTTGMIIQAGDGGASDPGAGKPNGGPGGALSKVYIAGVTDVAANTIILDAGDGGPAPAGTAGRGGAATSIFVGFDKPGRGAPSPSAELLRDFVYVTSGVGGNGKIAGNGGAISDIKMEMGTAEGLLGAELLVISGFGGNSLLAGGVKAGAGGAISKVSVFNFGPRDFTPGAVNASTLIWARDGGQGSATAAGGAGGSISSTQLLGSGVSLLAGNGGEGKTGGAGGSLTKNKIGVKNSPVLARVGVFNAGAGGHGLAGAGGAGGDIVGFLPENKPDYESLTVNGGNSANGGESVGGKGGRGGSVRSFGLEDIGSRPVGSEFIGAATLRAGKGGNGEMGGGAGGELSKVALASVDLDWTVTAGHGGHSTSKGSGGAGGGFKTLALSASGAGAGPTAFAHATSGTGGNGGNAAGFKTNGGAGGHISTAVVVAAGPASLMGGNGGSGSGGAPGKGASIDFGVVVAGREDVLADLLPESAGLLRAGDAGAAGAKPAAGGSVFGKSLFKPSGATASGDVTIRAGDGSQGGAGGSLVQIAYGGADGTIPPTGHTLISAGDGSVDAAGKFAGVGGSIFQLLGMVTSGPGSTTTIKAGDGAGNAAKSSNGGSIGRLAIAGDGSADPLRGGIITVTAGDAGNAGVGTAGLNYAQGARGGSLVDINFGGLSAGTVLRSLAAGDGGSGKVKGGVGGSVLGVLVADHGIGVKTGQVYGYGTMGGIFAGLGGIGGTTAGLAGKVQLITADSISSIVAGKGIVPGLVEQVDHIILTYQAGDLPPNLPRDVPTSAASEFVLIFHPTVEVVDMGGANDVQVVTRLLGGSNSSRQPPGGPTTFQLAFGNATTDPLDADASLAQIEAALDQIVPGGVVLSAGPGNTFFVIFQTPGAQPLLTGIGEQETGPLSGSSTPAEVATELNKLPNIFDDNALTPKFSGVNVIAGPNGGYQVTFNDREDQGAITGERLHGVVTSILTPGTPSVPQVELLDVLGVGEFQLTVNVPGFGTQSTPRLPAGASAQEVEDALNNLSVLLSINGPVSVEAGINSSYVVTFPNTGFAPVISGSEFSALHTTEVTPGTAGASEVQSLEFPRLRPANPQGLTFVIPGNGLVTVPGDATAQQVQDALNTVLDDGNPNNGTLDGVTVSLAADLTYSITFLTLADKVQITAVQSLPAVTTEIVSTFTSTDLTPGSAVEREVQHLEPGTTATPFGLTFGADTTSVPSANPTAQQVQDALNSLPSVQGAGGVTVTGNATNGYDVEFNLPGSQGQISGGFPESQTLDVNNLGAFTLALSPDFIATENVPGGASVREVQRFHPGTTLASFHLSFNGQTATVPANATALQVQDGLNSLTSVQAAGGVTASGNATNGYEVTFNTNGPRNAIYGGSAGVTTLLQPNASAAQVQDKLNAVLTAAGLPQVTVTGGVQGFYSVTFQGTGNRPPFFISETVPLFTPAPPAGLSEKTIQLTIPSLATFIPAEYAAAHLVGAIVDFNELGANLFKFIDADNDGLYDFTNGEIPLDGLIAAKKLSLPTTTTFTPQARYALQLQLTRPYVPVTPGLEFVDFLNP